jgi:hypothetical protein
MQSEVGATVGASRDRLIGTAIGAAAEALFGMLGSNGLLWFGLASTLTILICHLLGLEQSYLRHSRNYYAGMGPGEYGHSIGFWKLRSELSWPC